MKIWNLFPACVLSLALISGAARANRYDLHLGNFVSDNCTVSCGQELFDQLMRELGLATAPVFLSPAETLGLNGFSFSLEGSVVPIHNDEDYWQVATEGDPSSVLFIPHIHIRKGLPFSFEVGAQMSYVPESELFVMGAELKWALNEGFYFIPDFAVRFSINHMIGAKDFELSTGGWDVSLSKAFGVGGMLSLTPYVGYNMMFVHASSHVVLDSTAAMNQVVFGTVNWQDNMFHRFFVGCRLKTYIFQITVEGLFSNNNLHMFNFKLGFDY
ncbi:MAG: hypothetical protein DRI34_01040 [Deltaproteobacteria bacterium]|nr:MAG: hypothetical protein DRI34_01040 [Deltaproteobacteria bacterium]